MPSVIPSESNITGRLINCDRRLELTSVLLIIDHRQALPCLPAVVGVFDVDVDVRVLVSELVCVFEDYIDTPVLCFRLSTEFFASVPG